jgi:hypothetical protein
MGLPISDEALVLLAMIVLLSGVLRWFFGSDTGKRADRQMAKAADYGLLAEVATAPSEQAAKFVQDQLRRNGIRATTAPSGDGARLRVLVFPKDARAAADVLLRDD